jgi:cephalosporin-C deacetylase-like acetyl esterase
MIDDGRDELQEKVHEEKEIARNALLKFQPFSLKRKVFFIHGWGDQENVCWTLPYTDQDTIKNWVDKLVINKDEMVYYIKLDDDETYYYENFFQFANLLRYKINSNRTGEEAIDLICHSMGGLDSVALIAVDKKIDTTKTIYYPYLKGVNRLITVSTPHQGSPAARLADTEIAEVVLHESEYIATQGANMDIKSDYMQLVNSLEVRNRLLKRVASMHMFGGGDDIVVPPDRYKINTNGLKKNNYMIYPALDLARHSQVMGITQDVRMAYEIFKLLSQ